MYSHHARRAPSGNTSSSLSEAAQNVGFVVGPVDPATGARPVTVSGVMNGPAPPLPPKPYPCHRNVCPSNLTALYLNETLDVRIVVDRPVVEVYVGNKSILYIYFLKK